MTKINYVMDKYNNGMGVEIVKGEV